MNAAAKPVTWVRSARKDLKGFPREVQRAFGYALWQVQQGKRLLKAKVLKGFKGPGVLELIEDYDGGTYRVVYTVRFASVVYVLHAFQKKSKTGIKTPLKEIELIRTRLRAAEEHHAEWQSKKSDAH